MIIKLTEIDRNAKISSYDAVEVIGTKIDDGSKYSKKYFANDDNLNDAIEEIGIGDYCNLKLEKVGKFYNLVGIKEASKDEVDKALANAKKYPPKDTGGGGGGYAKKSTWNGRTGEAHDRSAAAYLAFDIMKLTMTEAKMKKMGPENTIMQLFSLANGIYEYIHMGNDGMEKEVGQDEETALTPPAEDND